MASWFSRRRPLTELPRLKPRNERVSTTRVDLHEVAPDLIPYLGQVAYLQLEAFQTLSQIVAVMPELSGREQISAAAGAALTKYQAFVAEIRRRGEDPAGVMQPYSNAVDVFRAVSRGADWQETLLGAYVTTGLLDDFFIRLAEGLTGDFGPKAAQLLGTDSGQNDVVEILRQEIAADPRLASRLAMWGRRLVGDTLLVARSVLRHPERNSLTVSDEQQIEPVFTELIAAHTRRMDSLGLTA